MGDGELRIELDGRSEASDGPVIIAFDIAKDGAQAVEGLAILRVECDGLAVTGDGLVDLALLRQRISQVEADYGRLRVELDGLAEASDGPVVIAFDITRMAPRLLIATT